MTVLDVAVGLSAFSSFFYVLLVFALGIEAVALVVRVFARALPDRDAPR